MVNEKATIGGLGILYVLSRIGMILLSFALFGPLLNNTLQVGTVYAKTFALCQILVVAFGIFCLILFFQRRRALSVMQQLAFLAALVGYGALALSALQEAILPVVFMMMFVICLEAAWTLYIRRSKQVAAWLAPAAKPQELHLSREMNLRWFQEIGVIISRGHPGISRNLLDMTTAPLNFFSSNKSRYAQRGITAMNDQNACELMWLGIVDELIAFHYAAEVDWKAEPGDILWNLEQIVQQMGLPVRFDDFTPAPAAGNDTEGALREIARYLLQYGLIMGYIDIDSDSTVLFLTEPDAVPMLQERAQSIWSQQKNAKSIEEADACRKKISFSFGGHNFEKDAKDMPRFDRVGAGKAMRQWLTDIAASGNIPQDITAINFGLFEPYGVELTGARRYDQSNDDWACEEDYVPAQRTCPDLALDQAMPWQQALCGMARVIGDLMAELPDNPVLAVPNVTIGFGDGDLFRLEHTKSTEKPRADDTDTVPPKLDAVIHDFIEETKLPTIDFTPVRGKTTVYSNKLGGTPYLPLEFEYPLSRSKHGAGKPLHLICQLNFAELPKLEGFPQSGILQFYADPEDDLIGLDFDDYCSQKAFRVVYHQDIIDDDSLLQAPPNLHVKGESYFPFSGEFRLEAKLGHQGMCPNDFRFSEAFMKVYRRYFNTDHAQAINIPSEQYEKVYEILGVGGHRAGGYPFFTQTDPREDPSKLDCHTVLLFQLDSDHRTEIMWGDSGIANFFIEPEKLAALDFSNVAYNWDCY